jgi:hypothetical protein
MKFNARRLQITWMRIALVQRTYLVCETSRESTGIMMSSLRPGIPQKFLLKFGDQDIGVTQPSDPAIDSLGTLAQYHGVCFSTIYGIFGRKIENATIAPHCFSLQKAL